MNNKEIRDALVSVFLDAELTVRVKHARSTESIYITVSNNVTSYVVRIAHHRSTVQFTKIHDYWINPTHKDVIQHMNEALSCASLRFDTPMGRIPDQEAVEVLSEECVQKSDNPQNSDDHPQNEDSQENLISLANYYVNEGYWVPEMTSTHQSVDCAREEVNNVLEDVLGEKASSEPKLTWIVLGFVCLMILFYCLK